MNRRPAPAAPSDPVVLDDPIRMEPEPEPPQLRRLRAFAQVMDSQFAIPGTPFRFGVDGLLGLIPGVGDVLAGALSSYLIAEAVSLKVSKLTIARMVVNTGVDTVLGAVPLVGDLFDIGFKANAKNARLIIADVERRARRS